MCGSQLNGISALALMSMKMTCLNVKTQQYQGPAVLSQMHCLKKALSPMEKIVDQVLTMLNKE